MKTGLLRQKGVRPSGASDSKLSNHGLTTSLILLYHLLGNPVLNKISSTAWEYADIVPDYQVRILSDIKVCSAYSSVDLLRLALQLVFSISASATAGFTQVVS
jgi:hypothetical protein